MSDITRLTQLIDKFNTERDWDQFHNPKDLALSLVLESTEVLEHFQWKNGDQIAQAVEKKHTELEEEVADVGIYLLQLCNKLKINLAEAIEKKIKKNTQKYPIEKSKGTSKKYTELR